MLRKKIMTLAVALTAAHSVACSLQVEQILEVGEGSELVLNILDLPPNVLPLEGGTVMNIDIEIGFFDLLLGNVDGDIAVGELLIASPAFDFLGIPVLNTGTICVVPFGEPGGGTFDANLYLKQATFDVQIDTIALLGNPVLASTLPNGGFEFPFDLQSEVPFGLAEALGLLTGSGSLEITEEIDLPLDLQVDLDGPGPGDPLNITGTVGGQISLASTDAFPTTPLLDECIDFLGQ